MSEQRLEGGAAGKRRLITAAKATAAMLAAQAAFAGYAGYAYAQDECVPGVPCPVPPPSSKELCKDGGYAFFGFKNQGQCVAFVERGPKNEEEVPS